MIRVLQYSVFDIAAFEFESIVSISTPLIVPTLVKLLSLQFKSASNGFFTALLPGVAHVYLQIFVDWLI